LCISTLNRASFIGATLDNIIAQLSEECEIVVVDGASVDNTESVVMERKQRFHSLTYVKQRHDRGLDHGFDTAVFQARGKYCWLMCDDDLLKPVAIETVLSALRCNPSLVLVNPEHKDFTMSKVLIPDFFCSVTDRTYKSGEEDRLFQEIGTCLIYIGCVVIRRDLWIQRERSRFYGSMFIHVGVIFQQPLPGFTRVLAAPLIEVRLGNTQIWARDQFEIWYIKWPSLIWSLPLSRSTKSRFSASEPWRRVGYLLAARASGSYSFSEYLQYIRPRFKSVWKRAGPAGIALMPKRLSGVLYKVYRLAHGTADPGTMFPEAVKALARAQSH
jgi:abequosyltransferase